jgi:hypothetical protein
LNSGNNEIDIESRQATHTTAEHILNENISTFAHMYRSITIFVLLQLFAFTIYGQKKFSAGINFGTEWSFMKISTSNAPGDLDESGTPGLGYAVGLQVQYALSEKLFLRSGATCLSQQHRHKISGLRFETDIQNMTESSIRNTITISSIAIPLDLGLRLPTKSGKLHYLFGVGGAVSLHMDTGSEARIESGSGPDEDLTKVENDVKEPAYAVGLFGGLEFGLGERLILGIEPNVRFTPNEFTLYPFDSEAMTAVESGLTLRLRM